MLERNDVSCYPILKASSIIFEDVVSNEALLARIEQLSRETTRDMLASHEAMQRIEAEVKAAAERRFAGQ